MEKKKYISENFQLMQEWDWDANADLDPTKLTVGSGEKVWWKCFLCGNKWQTAIYNRAKSGSSCPICHHGRWARIKRSSCKISPQIAMDWHPTKNGQLTPNMFSKGSRFQAWWKCHICGKEIKRSIKSYKGCKNCKRLENLSNKSLAITNPELLKEWNYEKNVDILPTQIFASNPKKVWWICRKCRYTWESKINNRALLGRGCPCCSNKIVVQGKNDLETTHPELAKEWHPTRNGQLTPKNITYGCDKKVWWLCPRGHEYQATVNHRTGTKGTNCPICSFGAQTSFAEQALYFYVKKLFPDAINRYKADFLGKMELDIYIPSIKWAIEYDGEAFHKEDKLRREQRKYNICQKYGIKLIRFREKEIKLGQDIADESYYTEDMSCPKNLEKIIMYFLKRLHFFGKNSFQVNPFDVDIERDRIRILKSFATEYKKGSFGELYPELAKEWHPTKNEGLTPYMFKPGSEHKVWWKCSKCGNEYQTTVARRTQNGGCIKCGIKQSNEAKMKSVNMMSPKTGDIIKTFSSITEAAVKMHINSSNISMVCKGIRPKAGGYIWQYADGKENKKHQKETQQLEFDFKSK